MRLAHLPPLVQSEPAATMSNPLGSLSASVGAGGFNPFAPTCTATNISDPTGTGAGGGKCGAGQVWV